VQGLAHRGHQIEGQHGVAEGAADEELHRQVEHPLHVLLVVAADGLHPAPDQVVAHRVGHRVEPVFAAGRLGVLGDLVNELVADGTLQRRNVVQQVVVLAGELLQVHGESGAAVVWVYGAEWGASMP
jgi:hypothetical protein